MTMRMTHRERVLTTSRRQVPDRVPKWIDYESFAPGLMETFRKETGATKPEEFFDYDVRQVHFGHPVQRRELEAYIPDRIAENAKIDWNWGNVMMLGDHKNVAVTVHYALEEAETVEDIEAYPMPDFLAKYRWEHVKGAVDELHRRELAAMGAMSMTLFEVAWGVRGFENFLTDMIDNKEMARTLLDRITDMRCEMARIFVKAGVDVLRLGDDVGTERGMMIGRGMWAEWLKPRLASVIRAAREIRPDILVFYHSDGDCRESSPNSSRSASIYSIPFSPNAWIPPKSRGFMGTGSHFGGQ